ncbi:Molybdate-anion transporter [Seminavis robusta]|uniref:Molybdate-anion transporter n=1 Tax=Seminavis robusta TaxID=568900 RepID=A0A9N8E8Y9_9STRA|nr:Molybdate-anion transporter [Seminavis robusta]|eukprot:Sro639_g179800.1 Molybdate-anion transporter (510) ;mRNA; r:47061-48781
MSETPFFGLFCIAVVVNVGVTLKSTGLWTVIAAKLGMAPPDAIANSEPSDPEKDKQHLELIKRYLLVYLLATMSDWLQGPYVYALYADYGYEQHEIAILFVAGFGSSMVFGSFVGGMADWGGRRTFVILYAMFYALSCMTKHFQNFWVLMLGRLLGGVATSLLFSVFDAWLIRAHSDRHIKNYLGKSFSWACYGNSIVAIVAGLIANNAASSFPMAKVFDQTNLYYGGYLNPFDISLLALGVCGACAATLWEENYGDDGISAASSNDSGSADDSQAKKGSNGLWYDALYQAFLMAMRNNEILFCGLISSLFEGSMYIFVFMWTPAMTGGDADIKLPFGLIFSTFMVNCMIGSSLFGILMDKGIKVENLGVGIFALASFSMFIVATASNKTMAFIAMNLFEVSVGLYWPTMGTMKGSIVPESKRAAIYNLYRIPLNFIVLFSLLTDLTPTTSFFLNTIMLGTATVLQHLLRNRRVVPQGTAEKDSATEPLVSAKSSEDSTDDLFLKAETA